MKENLSHAKQMEKKYYKVDEVSNFKDLLYRSEKLYSKKPAFKVKDKEGNVTSITYETFKKDIIHLGTTLINKGFTNKRIAVIGKNSYNWCVSYLAAAIVGIVVPIDKELHTDDVTNFMNVSKTVCILGDNKNLSDIQKNINKLENKETTFITFEKDIEKQLEEGKKQYENGVTDFDNIEIDPNEMRIILFTSGTTGSAKGVCLSQNNICSNITAILKTVKAKRADIFFSVLPLHHTYECTIGFLLPIYAGCAIAHCEGLRYIAKNMQEFHPSVILCVPLLLEKLHKNIVKNMNKTLPEKYRCENDENPFDKLPFFLKRIVKRKVRNTLGGRLRLFIVGAAAPNPNILADFRKFDLKSLQGYGLTECSPLVAGNNDFFHKDDSAGLPIPGTEYKIESPNDEGVGEIIVKGPNVMLGYYEDEEKTKETVIDGWFHTGDLGKIDENGYLYITGRCKSVIVTKNGKNIYPEEVEYYLNDNPLIEESLVLGIKKENDDETYINAQIYPNIKAISEQLKSSVPTKEEIRKAIQDVISNVNKKLPNYKHIKSFGIRETEFEKTTTQKVKRYGDNMKISENEKNNKNNKK